MGGTTRGGGQGDKGLGIREMDHFVTRSVGGLGTVRGKAHHCVPSGLGNWGTSGS